MRIDQITFTRFIAAFAIVIFHFGLKIFPFSHPLVSPIFYLAKIGVSYFFILSGFIMVIAYHQKSKINFIDFIKNRVARIFPVYLFAISLFVLHNAIFGGYLNFKDIILNVTTLQAWIPGKALSLNYPGWSLSVEFFFYALFPFLFNLVFKKYDLKVTALLILLFWAVSQLFFNIMVNTSFYQGYGSKSHDFLYYFPFLHLNQFLIGNIAGFYFINNPQKRGNFDIVILGLILVLIILLRLNLPLNYHNGLMAVVFVPLVLFVAYNQGFITKIFQNKTLIFLGEISFGMYILQVPIYYWSKQILKAFQLEGQSITFYFSVAFLILFSSLSYLYLEVPVRNLIKNFKFESKNNNSPSLQG